MGNIHHVNLGMPDDTIASEGAWLVEVLGCESIAGPPNAHWFRCGSGPQIHLSPDSAHRPAAVGHVAVEFADLGPIRSQLEARGENFRTSENDEVAFLFCSDPAGNRWELRAGTRP